MNSALLPVPDDRRVSDIVERQWRRIRKEVLNGRSVEFDLCQLDKAIEERDSSIRNHDVDMSYDWVSDLERAKFLHGFYRQWMVNDVKYRKDKEELWVRAVSRMEDFSEKVALSGINLIFVAHGAVALGALRLLSEGKQLEPWIRQVSYFAIIVSIFGIISFSLGKFLIFYYITHFSGKIRGNLIGSISDLKYNSFYTYLRRYRKYITAGDYVMYLSILLFVINIVVSGSLLCL